MSDKKQSVHVLLHFMGDAVVEVPAHLDKQDARLLATKIALARVLATFENPDAPEEDAFEEYSNQSSKKAQKTADKDWDATVTEGIAGGWNGWVIEPPTQPD